MAVKNPDIAKQAIKAKEGQVREQPYVGKKLRKGYEHGERVHLFDRHPVAAPASGSLAFSGRGFLPNVMNSHGLVTMPELSKTTLENEGVHGREGMMPPAGKMLPVQRGQGADEGAGGAGSFATVSAFGAKMGG